MHVSPHWHLSYHKTPSHVPASRRGSRGNVSLQQNNSYWWHLIYNNTATVMSTANKNIWKCHHQEKKNSYLQNKYGANINSQWEWSICLFVLPLTAYLYHKQMSKNMHESLMQQIIMGLFHLCKTICLSSYGINMAWSQDTDWGERRFLHSPKGMHFNFH